MLSAGRKRKDQIRLGFIPGLLLPAVFFLIMYFVSGQKVSFAGYLLGLQTLHVLIKLLTLCVLPNLVLLLYFSGKKYDLAVRGVLMATFLYAFVVVVAKIV